MISVTDTREGEEDNIPSGSSIV